MNRPSRRAAVMAAVIWIGVGFSSGAAAGSSGTAEALAPRRPVSVAGRACGPKFSDPLPETPWALRRLQPKAAWSLSRGQGVTVAVIDSGVSRRHPKLENQVVRGIDYVPGGKSVGDCDESAHGTLVAAIIAASDTEDRSTDAPYYGIAPDARILPIRVLADTKWSQNEDLPGRIATAIRWAVDHGADVINLSLQTEDTSAIASAVAYAADKNVVLVAAAGNQESSQKNDRPVYPAAYDDVIAVAGIDENGKHVSTSSTGDYVDVAAPGQAIVGPAPQGGGYVVNPPGGTSFAAPYVSGVAALIRARWPRMKARDVARRIRLTADAPPDGHNAEVGYGVVNPYRAVATLLEPVSEQGAVIGGRVPPPSPVDDPLRTTRWVSIWAAIGGIAVAGVVFLVRALRRRKAPSTG